MPAALRWAGGTSYRSNRRFGRAIREHGWQAFDHFILGFFDDRQSLNDAECAAIEAAGGHQSRFTYNLSSGGDVVADNSKAVIGVHLPTMTIQRFSSGAVAARELGIRNADQPMAVARGKRTCVGDWWFRFEEDVDREPPTVWGEQYRLSRIAEVKNRPVVAMHYETQERRRYESINAAASDLNVNQSTVSEVAGGKSHSVKGWFVYYEDQPRALPKAYGTKAQREQRDVAVYAVNLKTGTKRRFRNQTAAAEGTSLSSQSEVSAVLRGVRQSAGGWWFSYDPDEQPPSLYKYELLSKSKSQPVIARNLVTGEVTFYPSAKVASEETGVARSSISRILNGTKSQAKGYSFERSLKSSD